MGRERAYFLSGRSKKRSPWPWRAGGEEDRRQERGGESAKKYLPVTKAKLKEALLTRVLSLSLHEDLFFWHRRGIKRNGARFTNSRGQMGVGGREERRALFFAAFFHHTDLEKKAREGRGGDHQPPFSSSPPPLLPPKVKGGLPVAGSCLRLGLDPRVVAKGLPRFFRSRERGMFG